MQIAEAESFDTSTNLKTGRFPIEIKHNVDILIIK